MTTIAWDGKTLAADSLISAGTTAFGTAIKVHKLKDGSYAAFAGRASIWPSLIEWLNGGEKPVVGEEDSVSVLVVDKKGKAYELEDDLRPAPACVPWAGGSGQSFALAAMKMGHSAVEAVEVACQLDLASRGPIQEVRIVK